MKSMRVLVWIGLLGVAVSVQANMVMESWEAVRDNELNALNVGVGYEYFKYDEPGLMKESGWLPVLFASYMHHYDETIMMRIFTSYAWGDLDYDGGIQRADGTTTPLKLDTPNNIFDLRIDGGYRFPDVEVGQVQMDVTPYAGLGYRFLKDDLPGDYGYTRKQTYYYLPIGVQVLIRQWEWGFLSRLEFDWLLKGKNKSDDNDFTQDKGYGFRASVQCVSPPVSLGPLQDLVFAIEPFFQYWNVDESNEDGGYVEPDNNSKMFGLLLSTQF